MRMIFLGFFDFYKGMGTGVVQGLYYLLWIIPLLAIFTSIIVSLRGRMIYKYPVRIFRVRESGKVIESNHKGGYIGRKGSGSFFRIKTGKWYWGWWWTIDLTTTPRPEYFDEQNRVYYKQIDVATFVQLKRIFSDDGKVSYSPVESDVKYGAILDINRIDKVLVIEPAWKKILPYAGMVLVAIVLIVGYAILLNTKCP